MDKFHAVVWPLCGCWFFGAFLCLFGGVGVVFVLVLPPGRFWKAVFTISSS